jgi:hypothetical protein
MRHWLPAQVMVVMVMVVMVMMVMMLKIMMRSSCDFFYVTATKLRYFVAVKYVIVLYFSKLSSSLFRHA